MRNPVDIAPIAARTHQLRRLETVLREAWDLPSVYTLAAAVRDMETLIAEFEALEAEVVMLRMGGRGDTSPIASQGLRPAGVNAQSRATAASELPTTSQPTPV